MSILYRGDYYPEYEPLEYQVAICPRITNDEWVYYEKTYVSPIEKMNKIIKEVDEEMDKVIKKDKKKIDKMMDTLVKKDKPRDKKIEKCDAEMKMKAKKKR